MHTESNQVTFLKSTPLFNELSSQDTMDLVALTKNIHFKAQHTIIKQGEYGDEMYIILDGSVSVCFNLTEGKRLSLGNLTVGDAFGEIALFDRRPRSASVISCTPCELMVMVRHDFNNYLMAHPQVAIQLLRSMSTRIRIANDFLNDAMYTDIRSRLAETLYHFAQAYGKYTHKGDYLEVSVDNDELGRIAGISSDVVKQLLDHWHDTGIVKNHNGHLTLLKLNELADQTHSIKI